MSAVDGRQYFLLFAAFFRLGLFTFGGGYAMIPIIEREMVDRNGWLTEEELIDSLSIIQALPGAVAVNTALIVGARIAGGIGAFLAALGVVIPSFLVILAIAGAYHQFSSSPLVDAFFEGVRPVVVGLIVASAIKFGRRVLVSPVRWLLAGTVFLLITIGHVNPIYGIILASLVGLLFGRSGGGEKEQDTPFAGE